MKAQKYILQELMKYDIYPTSTEYHDEMNRLIFHNNNKIFYLELQKDDHHGYMIEDRITMKIIENKDLEDVFELIDIIKNFYDLV